MLKNSGGISLRFRVWLKKRFFPLFLSWPLSSCLSDHRNNASLSCSVINDRRIWNFVSWFNSTISISFAKPNPSAKQKTGRPGGTTYYTSYKESESQQLLKSL